MSSDSRNTRSPEDEALVSQFLQETSDLSQREAARRVEGVSQNDVSRWVRNEWSWLTAKKRRALRQFLSDVSSDPDVQAVSPDFGDPDGSPAERLAYWLTHPEVLRHFSGHPPREFVKAAFRVAVEEEFSPEEIKKLARWREEVRDREEGAPPTSD